MIAVSLTHQAIGAGEYSKLTPHLASSTETTQRRLTMMAEENIVASLFAGQPIDLFLPGA